MNKFQSSIISLGTLVFTVISGGTAQTSFAADLWEIYELALASDPGYRAAALNHEATLLNLPLAKSGFKPSLSTSAVLGRQTTDIRGPDVTSDENQYSIDASLPLYDKSKRLEITQSRYATEISALQLLDEKHRLMLEVANRYFNLLAGQDAREVARLEKIAIKRQMDFASERLEVGLGTRTDLFDAKARFKQAEANEIQAQNKINNDIALLKQLIGSTPEALATLSDTAPLDLPLPNDVDAWIDVSSNGNVPLNIETLNLEIARAEIDKQRSARRPTLDLTASHRIRESGANFSSNSETNTSTVGITLTFPIYLGGTINLRTKQAGFQFNRNEQLLEQAKRQAATETTTAFLAVSSGVSQVEALADAITAGESALEAKEEGFYAGLTTNIDVLDAQRDLSRSRTDYLRARYTYILSVLDLERSTGQLDEEDIKRINSWLESS